MKFERVWQVVTQDGVLADIYRYILEHKEIPTEQEYAELVSTVKVLAEEIYMVGHKEGQMVMANAMNSHRQN
jgi:hypothetical protein